MKNQDNQQPTRKYSIYLHEEKRRIPVSKEVYQAYYRPIWRLFRREHDHGQCSCPGNLWWRCIGDCGTCKYCVAGDSWSLDYEQEILGDIRPDPNYDLEEIVADRICLEELSKVLDRLDPDSRRICDFIRAGKSERDSAAELGIPRSTYQYRKDKVLELLKESLIGLF